MKKLLTIQDISCYGQCSITIALPVVSSCNVETIILPTMLLSTHTCGFKNFTVLDLYQENKKIINHWKNENIKFDAVYTGYLGNISQIEMVKSINKELNLDCPLYVDPVMADYGKLYPAFNIEYVEKMKELVAISNCVVPNLTEACFLLNREYKETYSEEEIKDLLKSLSDLGPTYSVITGISFNNDTIGAYAYNKETNEYFYHSSVKSLINFHGTGDLFSSILFGKLTNGISLNNAVKDAVEYTYLAIKNTIDDVDNHAYGVHFESILKYLNK